MLSGAYALPAFLGALSLSCIIVSSGKSIRRVCRARNDERARQASHVGDPLRLGGVAVLLALAFAMGIYGIEHEVGFGWPWLASAVPVVLAGLLEDMGYRVSAWRRFVAALVSAGFATVLLGMWAPRGNLPGIDLAMLFPPVAIAVSVIFSGVFCHATNLVDGMNGLATTIVIAASVGLAAIAWQAGVTDAVGLLVILASATAGFLAVNWPRGYLLLGDAGAYGLGHLLVWAAIAIAWQSDEVAVPALLLTLFWPIADVLHTVLRRVAIGASIFQPDRMHLHQKIRRALDLLVFGYRGRSRSNPLTTVIMVPMICVPVITGVYLWDQPGRAWGAMAVFFALFVLTHYSVLRVGAMGWPRIGGSSRQQSLAAVTRPRREHDRDVVVNVR